MVRIPQPQPRGQKVGSIDTTPANTPTFNVRPADTSQMGQDLQSLGQSLSNVAVELQDRTNDAALREAELAYMDFEREVLDPQNGVFARRQGNAIGATAEVTNRFQEVKGDILGRFGDRVSNNGKQALEQYLTGAEQRMWKRVASHELSEATAHEESLIAGQMEAQMDRASLLYTDGAEVAAAEIQVSTLAGDLADARGLTGQAREQFIEKRTTALHAQVASQMAANSPSRALEYVEEMLGQGKMDPTEAQRLLTELQPDAIEEQGSDLASSAVSSAGGSPTIDSIMPALFEQESGYGAGRSLEDAVTVQSGAGATGISQIMPGSGEDPGFGVTPYKYAGGVPEGTSAETVAKEQMRFGKEYLEAMLDRYNGNMTHALYAYNWGPGNVDSWIENGTGVDGQPMPNETIEYAPSVLAKAGYRVTEDGTESQLTPRERIAQEEDPEVRAVAMAELERMEAEQHKTTKRQREQFRNRLFADIENHVLALEAGEESDFNLDAILRNPANSRLLGDDVSAVRDYFRRRTTGEDVVTPPEQFANLETLRETDPEEFAQADILGMHMRGLLSRSDYERYAKEQAAIKGEAVDGRPYNPNEVYRAIDPALRMVEDDDVEKSLRVQAMDYVTSFMLSEGRPPTTTQMQEHAYDLVSKESTATGNIAGVARGNLNEIMREAEQKGLQGLLEASEKRRGVNLPIPMRDGTFRQFEVTREDLEEMVRAFVGYDEEGEFDAGVGLNRAPRPSELLNLIVIRESDLIP